MPKRRVPYSSQHITRKPRRGLEPLERRFGDEYLVDLDPEAAAGRAGLLDVSIGRQLLGKARVQNYLTRATRSRAQRIELQQDYVLRRWLQLEQADPRELVEHWIVPCRHCWGHDHRYQFTSEEMRIAQQKHVLSYRNSGEEPPPFDDLGGDGYTILRKPCRGADWAAFWREHGDPEAEPTTDGDTCPECYGEGASWVRFADTRELSENAALLYKGIRQTNTGKYEMLMRDQDEARKMIAQHLGYFRDREPIQTLDAALLEPDQIETAIVTMHQRLARDDPDALRALAPPEVLEGVEEK